MAFPAMPSSPRSPVAALWRRLVLLGSWLAPLGAQAVNLTVDTGGDAGIGAGLFGDIRYCLNAANANPGSTITFIPTYSSVTLTSPLPPITSQTYISGNFPTISGGGVYRIFFVDAPPGSAVTFVNLILQDGRAKGGNGGAGGGGGGLGAGGAIFVNSGSVTIDGCSFANCSAVGGNGGIGSAFTFVAGGGGGGLGGNGGDGVDLGSRTASGGGGGWFGNGGTTMGGGGGRFTRGGDGLFNGTSAGGGGGGGLTVNGGNATSSPPNITGGAGANGVGGAGLNSNAALTAGNGANGGGGGGGSITSNGSSSAQGTGGDGGKYGGGGAGGVALGLLDGYGGAGGDFGGGGGAAGRNAGQGGTGGFGGGGGGGPFAQDSAAGSLIPSSGRGGFGAGAGGCSIQSALGPAGPFGGAGGQGPTNDSGVGGGGGGGALGGVVFVRDNNGATIEIRNTTVPAGTLLAGQGGAGVSNGNPGQPGSVLGTAVVIPRSGLNILTGNSAVAFNGTIADLGGAAVGALSLTAVDPAGSFIFRAANTYGGGTNINSGTLYVSGAGTLGATTAPLSIFNTGTLDLFGTSQSVGVCDVYPTGAIVNTSATPASLTVGTSSLPHTFSGSFTGNISLTKAGTGLTNVVSNCQYTGTTTVLGGFFRFSQLGSIYNNGTLAGSSLALQNCTLEFSRSDTFGNAAASPATALVAQTTLIHNVAPVFNKLADVTLVASELRSNGGFNSQFQGFHLSGTLTVSGPNASLLTATTVQNSFNAVQLGNNGPGGTTTFLVNDATNSVAVDLTVSAPLADSRLTANPAIAAASGLVKAGAGTLLLSAANSYTGGTTINAGILALGHASGLGTTGLISFGGGTLRYESGISADLSHRLAAIPAGQFIRIDTNGQNVQFMNPTSGAGGLVKSGAGTLTLIGPHNHTGLTTISAGTLQLGDGVSNNGSLAGNITNNAALVFGNVSALAYSGLIGGSGSVTKNGAGTLTWNTRHDYAGTTTVNAGTLTLAPGAELAASPTVTVGASATLNHQGIIQGAVVLNGTLNGSGAINGGLTVAAGANATANTGTWPILGNIVNQGTIRVTNGAVFQAGSATSFVNQGVLDLMTAGATSTLPGNFTNSGAGLVLLPSLVRVKTALRTLNPDNTTYTVTVTIDGYQGHNYTLQRSTSLAAGTFTNLGGAQAGSGTATPATLTFTDPSAPANAGFYRVSVDP